MAESTWPAAATSRVVTDAQYEILGRGFACDGILAPSATTAVYGDSSGRQVKVRANKAGLVRGHGWDAGATDTILPIAANSSGSTRYDVVVLRYSRSTYAVAATVVQGTGGAGVPAITRDAGTTGSWDVPVAVVTVANGASTITAGNVVDVAPLITVAGDLVYPSIAARGYSHPSPTVGDRCFLSDGLVWSVYNGSAWKFEAGAERKARLTSDASGITNNTTPAAVSGLSVSVAANYSYRMRARVIYTAAGGSTTGQIKLGWSGPSGATMEWSNIGLVVNGASGVSGTATFDVSTISDVRSFGAAGTSTSCHVILEGTLDVGSTAGSLSLLAAQVSPSATATTVKDGSYVELVPATW